MSRVDVTLTAEACRVLGSLLEKELTVPSTYPMTVNAVVSASNQTSGRDPILDLSEGEVEAALAELRRLGLTRVIHPSHGARTTKHRQVADEALGLDRGARAALTVLLLRGHQTPGEVRSRTERLHRFASVEEVEAALGDLSRRDRPLAVELTRRPGHKESRWAHLLAGPPSEPSTPSLRPTAPPASADRAQMQVPAEVAELAALVGTWRGVGSGEYPTIEPFRYTQEIHFLPVPGKPMLAYRSATRHRDDDRPLHAEAGFLRLVAPGSVELVVAQASGVAEISEGLVDVDVDTSELLVASTSVAGSSTAKSVTATERRYRVTGDELTHDLSMAAVGQPLTHHLHATLRRT